MLLGTAGTKSFSSVLVAKAGQFVAAVNAVAISGDGCSLNWYQSHSIYPFRQDSTGAWRFSQGPDTVCHCGRTPPKRFSAERADRACQYFPAVRSRACPASPEILPPRLDQTACPRNAGFPRGHEKSITLSGKAGQKSWRPARQQPRKCAPRAESARL